LSANSASALADRQLQADHAIAAAPAAAPRAPGKGAQTRLIRVTVPVKAWKDSSDSFRSAEGKDRGYWTVPQMARIVTGGILRQSQYVSSEAATGHAMKGISRKGSACPIPGRSQRAKTNTATKARNQQSTEHDDFGTARGFVAARLAQPCQQQKASQR